MTPPTWLHWPAAGGSTPWAPTDLASLYAWYKADAITGLSDGDPVSTWADSSGNGYDLTSSGAFRPSYETNTLNSLAVVEFSGTNYITAATASDWDFLHQAGGSTIVAVCKFGTSANPDTTYALLGTLAANSGNHGLQITFDDRSSLGRDETLRSVIGRGVAGTLAATQTTANNTFTPNAAGIVSVTSDPGNATAADRSSIRANGGTETKANTETNAASASTASYPLGLGTAGGSQLALVGYIAEVVICNAKLADSDREKLEGYLAHKWGLESNLPNTHPYKNSAP